MVGFIDAHRETYGVEPICGVLPIAPSVYYELKAREREPAREPTRTRRDASLGEHVGRVWRENREVYGVRKVWKHLQREGPAVARCTVGRLLRQLGLRGAARGRKFKATTIADTSAARPADLVTRQFTATRPNQLWVADLMYVAAWRGFMYVAFVIDVLSRRIVGWRAASSLRNDLALEPLEQALYARAPSGRRSGWPRPASSPRWAGTGDSYDNALAETVIGLFKTEEIQRRGPWKGLEDVEFATLEWVAWYNGSRLLASLGSVPPLSSSRPIMTGRRRRPSWRFSTD
jgi:putative transposase